MSAEHKGVLRLHRVATPLQRSAAPVQSGTAASRETSCRYHCSWSAAPSIARYAAREALLFGNATMQRAAAECAMAHSMPPCLTAGQQGIGDFGCAGRPARGPC
jgi:hypothetical protein